MNVSTAQARSGLSDVISRVSFGKERIIINRRGKGVVAMIPMEDYELLQAIENKVDLADAKAAILELETKGSKSWNKIKSELGL